MVKNTSKKRTAVTSNDTQKVNSANDHSDSIAVVDTNTNNTATSNTNIDGNIPSISANNTVKSIINPPSAHDMTASSQSTSKIDGHQSSSNNDDIAMGTSTVDIPTLNAKNNNAAISNPQISFTGPLSAQASIATNSQTLAADGTSQNNNTNNNDPSLA